MIVSDSWLSQDEKPEVIRQYDTINAEYAGLAARASALGITTPLTAYFNAITALNAYLAGLSPAWNNLTLATPVVGTTFRAAFALAYSTKADLQNAITAVLDTDIGAALSRLDAIASDSILSAGEKPQIIREWEVISGEYTGFATQLNVLGLSTELTNYNNAINALSSYLGGLSPAWNSTTTNTPIVAADFRTAFRTYYLAKDAGRNAMANVNPPVGVTASTGAVGGVRTGTGQVTSNTVTASITGGTSGATIRWIISGSSAVTPTAPDSFTSAFTATITTLGQSFEVIAVPFVTKGGRTYPGQPVNVSLSENA